MLRTIDLRHANINVCLIAYALCGLSNLRNESLFAARMRISNVTMFNVLNHHAMKGFIKELEYIQVDAISATFEVFTEIYDTEWREADAVKDLLHREDVIDEYIVEVKVSKCKRYITKMHYDE